MLKKALIAVVVVIALGAIASAGSSGTKTAIVQPGGAAGTAAPQAKVGDKVAAGNWEYTVTKIDTQKSVTWSQFGNKTDAKGTWLIAYLTLTNKGNQNFGIGAQDFELLDAGGVKYNSDPLTGSSYADFQKLTKLGLADQYPPGVAVNTLIMFDINPAATGLRLGLRQAAGTSIDLGK